MKKIKMYISIIIILIIMAFGNVYAHSVDLDPDSLVTLPMMIVNGNGTVSVKSSVTDYKLYYQWVDITTSTYTEISEINSKVKTYNTTTTEELNNKKDVYTQLKEIYDNENATDPLSEATTNAYNVYNAAVKEYNDLVKEYNEKIEEYKEDIKDLTPTYIESNWKESMDNKVSRDLSGFTGEKSFVLWVKLVTSGETSYDETIYTLNGNKKTDETNTNMQNNTVGNNTVLEKKENVDDTISPKSLPKTGVTNTVIFIIVLLAVGSGIIYKKTEKIKF